MPDLRFLYRDPATGRVSARRVRCARVALSKSDPWALAERTTFRGVDMATGMTTDYSLAAVVRWLDRYQIVEG